MRGFLGGVSIGAIVAVLGAAGLSILTPLAQRPEVSMDAPTGAEQPTTVAEAPSASAGVDADLVEATPSAPGEVADNGGDLSVLDSSVTDPGDKPRVGGATQGLSAPATTVEAPALESDTDTPVSEGALTSAPDAPGAETGVEAPEEPQAPAVTAEAPESQSGQVDVVAVAPSLPAAEDPVVDSNAGVQAQPPAVEATPEVNVTTAPAPEPVEPVVEAQVTPEVAEPETAPEEPQEDTRIAALPQTGGEEDAARPQIGTPVQPLTERNQAAPAAPEQPTAPAIPPIDAYAAEFDNPEGKPLMSILLIDDGDAVGAEALLDFPYPLSFAVDPEDPKAADKMAQYRAAGFEVVAMVDFPAEATPGDAETALEVWLGAVPETVALLEGVNSGIQGNRPLSDQVTAVVRDGGRGLITQDRGLNTVQKLAARDGVPSGVVFRDFDGAGQTPTVMRRFLDQAAFRAGQQGAVIMLGRVQPDTISALLLWGLQDRASRVALAPISASLKLER